MHRALAAWVLLPDERRHAVGQPIVDLAFPTVGGKTIRLGDYYDPAGKTPIRLLHISVIALWAGPTLAEVDFILGSNDTGQNTGGASWQAELAPEVVFLELLGGGATADNLTAFSATHPTANVALAGDDFTAYFDADALPLNIDIDTRTMVLLDVSVGLGANLDSILKLLAK